MTRKDYDEVKHYGNVTKINGAVVEPVDIITFGSPCGAKMDGERKDGDSK